MSGSDIPPAPRSRSRTSALQTVLFGYDFFISYRQADGAAYAKSLYRSLHSKGFDCFLDTEHYEAGHNLPAMQSRALTRSTKLVVVVSPLAHQSPPGTDWLVAEVVEFKHFGARRSGGAQIVPIGTRATLSRECFAQSRLLPEIPSPSADDICIFDAGVEANTEPAAATVAKLCVDFKQRRKRTLRVWTLSAALAAVACATGFGVVSGISEQAARRIAKQREAFTLLDRGREALNGEENLEQARTSLERAEQLLREVGQDPVMLMHHRLALSLKSLKAEPIATVEGETDEILLSSDGDWMLVTHDYEAPSGGPEPELIPDQIAFEVLHLPDRRWTLRQPIKSAIGREIYQNRGLVAFLPPDHVVIRTQGAADGKAFAKVSLRDGRKEIVEWPAPPEAKPVGKPKGSRTAAEKRLESLLSEERLYKTPPGDGIDRDYGARLVEMRYLASPDKRTALLGTYEGRLMLIDIATGLSRGEVRASSVFAVAYRPDGMKGYAADGSNLWEIDTGEAPGASAFRAPLRAAGPRGSREVVLGAALNGDASILALATSERLLVRRNGKWSDWKLPRPVDAVAALQVDSPRHRVDFVVAADGMIGSVDYESESPIVATLRPGGAVATVAWLDERAPLAWLVAAKTDRPKTSDSTNWGGAPEPIVVHAVPLPGGGARATSVPLPRLPENDIAESAAIHSLAKLGQTLVLFHGDDENGSDKRDVMSERMLQLSLDGKDGPSSRVVFGTTTGPNGPDTMSSTTQIETILPSSRPGKLLVRSTYGETFAIAADGRPRRIEGALAVSEHVDGQEDYEMWVRSKKSDVWFGIRHGRTRSILEYQLPWAYRNAPKFAAITPDGRGALVVSDDGECLLVDVSVK